MFCVYTMMLSLSLMYVHVHPLPPSPSQGKPTADSGSVGHFADQQSLNDLTQLVNEMQQEQERLIGTAAHLSHELDISKEHTKVREYSHEAYMYSCNLVTGLLILVGML